MRKISIRRTALAFMLFSALTISAQDGGIMISGGMASAAAEDMKYLQEYILSTYPLEGEITSSFPPFTSTSLTVFKQLYDQIRIGGGYSYATTGGKSSYADYSGEIYTEMSVTSHRLGAYLSYSVLGGERLDLSLYGKAEANLSSLSILTAYSIQNISNSGTNKYRSISPVGTVGTELMYGFRSFSLGLDAGYLVDLTGNLKNTDDGEALLDPLDRERILTTDWTGWQLKIKALLWLNF
jgi:hypothetical protein